MRKNIPSVILIVLVIPPLAVFSLVLAADEPVGKRPYEMEWANRTQDVRPALVDFENLDGWTPQPVNSVATFARSRQQQLWGRHVGKLVYRGTGAGPSVTLRPPKPIEFPGPVDCVNLWAYGNNWAWQSDPSTPRVQIAVLLKSRAGRELPVRLGSVNWKEWHLLHARMPAEQAVLLKDGGTLTGMQIAGGSNPQDRELFFDNLSVYREELKPLTFDPRPARNLTALRAQVVGNNLGPDKLPFPTREETILPDNLAKDFQVKLEQTGETYVFTYRGCDGVLTYRYTPAGGDLGDIRASWEGSPEFQPMAGGGVWFWTDAHGSAKPPEKALLLDCRRDGQAVVSRWKLMLGERTAEVTYTLRLWQKSLVIDVVCPGGQAGEVRLGRAVGLDKPRLVTLPYLVGDHNRPAVAVAGPADRPLFLMGLVDYYRSNASTLFALNAVDDGSATYNGGSRYLPRTDGRRNDCAERLFLTVSPRFEEVLPNVPNPKSPWMHVAGERLWIAHGAGNRQGDYDHWKRVARYGMTKLVITDHETGWRDGGESFTFRTKAAPGKGGDEGQADYARKVRALGFRYGIYNNYTDYAPVNEHWDEDRVTRTPEGDWRHAWARCYNPKPARAVEFEARLAPIIQQKFQLDTAYCDVHTAVQPWWYVDFDARVSGAGTFAATFYAYGEIMLHQKRTWNGPVYSEGNNHWYYCGLTDGNYGQDQAARLDERPWLVDFDLRKLHPLCCNFGMGNLGMFYGEKPLGKDPAEREAKIDRFLAATLAFGHTGFFVLEGGMSSGARSYFNLQQVHARYAQEQAVEIRYADATGKVLDTSAAVAGGACQRSQVAVRYTGGLTVTVNGHPRETWNTGKALLPPNGWHVHDETGKLTAWSTIVDDHRADYVDSPAYLYGDGRGRLTRFDKLICDGQLIVHKRENGTLEMIPIDAAVPPRPGEPAGPLAHTWAVSLGGKSATAVAVDEAGKELGPAEVRLSQGFVYVMPKPGAFSYVLTLQPAPAGPAIEVPARVVPGQKVTVRTQGGSSEFVCPAQTRPGQFVWHRAGEAWVAMEVVPLAALQLAWDGQAVILLRPNVNCDQAQASLGGQSQQMKLVAGQPIDVRLKVPAPTADEVRPMDLQITAGDMSLRRTIWLMARQEPQRLASLRDPVRTLQCFRKGQPTPVTGTSGAIVDHRQAACGGLAKTCLFMHPPYLGGVGYAAAIFSTALPAQPKARLRCLIGKGDGSDVGDGILFQFIVVSPDGKETPVAQKQWLTHAWTDLDADLSPWAGQAVQIKVVSDVGPADNSSGDWACWADLRIESLQPVLSVSLSDQAPKRQ